MKAIRQKILFFTLIFLPFILQSQNQHRIDSLKTLLKHFESKGIKDTNVTSLLYELWSETNISKPHEALNYLQKAKEIYTTLGNKEAIASKYSMMGNIFLSQEMYYLAMENYFKCYQIQIQLGETQEGAVAYTLNDIANTYFAQKIYDIPLVYYKKSVEIFKKRKDDYGLSVAYNNIGLVKRNTGQLDSALYYFNLSLNIRKKLLSFFFIAHSYNYIGNIYFRKADYNTAISYSYQVIDLLTKKKLKTKDEQSAIAEAYYSLGESFVKLNNFEEASINYMLSLEKYIKLGQQIDIIRTYIQIGVLYQLQKSYQLAEKYYFKAFEMSSKNKYIKEKRNCCIKLNNLYSELNDNSNQIKYLKLSLQLSDSLMDINLTSKLSEVHLAIETFNIDKETELLKHKNLSKLRLLFAIVIVSLLIILFIFYLYYNKRKNEKRLHQMNEASFEGILIHNNGEAVDCNNKFTEISGYTIKDLSKMSVFNIISPEQKDFIIDNIKNNLSFKYDSLLRKKDGTYLNIEASAQPIKYKNKNLRVVAIKDISERKKIEETLSKYAQELKELNATKDKFFSIIAHDLKNPFNGIIGFSEILLQELLENNIKNVDEYVRLIGDSAKKGYTLLENLLDWARSKTGRLDYKPKIINLKWIINEQIDLFTNNVLQKNIRLFTNANKDIYAYSDENLLKTVLRNLLSNAIKFTPINGLIQINIKEEDDFIEISVSDTGVGIKSEDLPKLFRIDINQTTLGTTGEKGTGLGLIITKEFVETNGGTISIYSQYGKGSQFTFTLLKPNKAQ